MISKYAVFCSVIELGSFTKTAKELNYSQSAVRRLKISKKKLEPVY